MQEAERIKCNQYQRGYFDSVPRSRLALGETPYVLAHLQQSVTALGLTPGQRVLEVGAGLGKFTLPLAKRGLRLVANDLSPVLLERLRHASQGQVKTLCSDVLDISEATEETFDRVLGFFVLHHLHDLEAVFRSLARVLCSGGLLGFCEPVAWNPLYYAQILCTPNMRFAGEPSLTSMCPGVVLPAMRAAGFVDAQARSYGYFPPMLKNHPAGDYLEQWLNKRAWVPFPHAFQIFTARLP